MAARLKTAFKLAKSFTPIYTGGAIAASKDGKILYTTLNEQVVSTDVTNGERLHLFQGDSSTVTTLSLSPENAASAGTLLVAHRSLALRFYALHDNTLVRSVARAHDAPIIISLADPTGSIFATGSADGVVKVWDAVNGHCTHVFRGHGGVVSALFFDVDPSRPPRLVSASDDCRVRLWDLTTRKPLLVLDGHSSVVRGLAVSKDGSTLVSGGRDKVLCVWDLPSGHLRHTIPVFETLEAIGIFELSANANPERTKGKGKKKADAEPADIVIWTAGDSGAIKLWDLTTGTRLPLASGLKDSGQPHEIVQVCSLSDTLITSHVDQNIYYHRIPTLEVTKTVVGFNDEVIDTVFLSSSSSDHSSSDQYLAVATNSDLIRVYDLQTFNTALLAGHSDVVLCLARSSSGKFFLSGSKDRSARIWHSTQDNESGTTTWLCRGIAEGHLESIGAVGIAPKTGQFMVTASQDKTVKIWDLISFNVESDKDIQKVQALVTLKVHDKDINTLDIAPNDRFLATGSQDRTAKLFGIEYVPSTKKSQHATAKLVPLGIFKGHKRGVWSVKFSPTEQTLATASGDRTVKLWNAADFTCLKTFEGHTNTVLRVDFLPTGLQLASCASDGLVKVWNIRDEECVATLDNHEDKIWALTRNDDASMLVSGGADSVISFWQDVTEEEEEEKAAAEEEQILKQQDLDNFMDMRDYKSAVTLALSMDQPRRLFGLLSEILSQEALLDTTASPVLASVLASLDGADIFRLLGYIRDWNARSKDSDVAQTLLYTLLKTQSMSKILQAAPGSTGLEVKESTADNKSGNIGEILEALLPYTERHYARADRLEQESAFLDLVLAHMVDFGDVGR